MKTEQLISGALFDFAAHLTTMEEGFPVGAKHPTPPVLEALKEWAGTRALDLDEAAVQTWQNEIGVAKARRTMREAFDKDPGFREAYVANIAMRLHDELRGAPSKIFNNGVRNELAERLLKLLFD
jgi:hypothetical protein